METFVMLLTGISGSGKTTLANAVAQEIEKLTWGGVQVVDGDETRKLVGGIFGHDREGREKIGYVNRMLGYYLVKNNISVIYALVCPYESMREAWRSFFGKKYIEVYVEASSQVCNERDVKGLYKRYRKGEIQNLNGMDDSFEFPKNCDLVVNTEEEDIETSRDRIIHYLKENHFLMT